MTSSCGTYAAYQRHHANGEKPCAPCTAANTAYHAERRRRRAADPAAVDRAGHGKGSTYRNYGCRCESCTAANTADVRIQRERGRAK